MRIFQRMPWLLLLCGVFFRDGGAQSAKRRILDADWELLWSTSAADTMFASVNGLAITSGSVVVSDPTMRRVVAFSRSNGALDWMFAHEGPGPRELAAPSTVAALRGDTVVVADYANGKLLYLDVSGRPVRELSTRGRLPRTLCALSSGDLLAGVMSFPQSLVWLGVGDSLFRALPAAFPEHGANPNAHLGRVGTIGGAACGFALDLADGLGLLRNGQFVWRRKYVEPLEAPVGDASQAPYGALAVTGDDRFVIVAFGGRTTDRGRLLDFYRVADGSYAGTVLPPKDLVPSPMYVVAKHGLFVAAVYRRDGIPVLSLFRVHVRTN